MTVEKAVEESHGKSHGWSYIASRCGLEQPQEGAVFCQTFSGMEFGVGGVRQEPMLLAEDPQHPRLDWFRPPVCSSV